LNGKTSSFWTIAQAGACFFRRQKNQSETMKAMSAAKVPPTMAPKLGVVEEAVAAVGDGWEVLVLVLVGVLVDWDKPEVGDVGVSEVTLAETVAETVGSESRKNCGIEELLNTPEDVLVLATEMLEEVAARSIEQMILNKGVSIVNSGLTGSELADLRFGY
jgi:hypothetical protein